MASVIPDRTQKRSQSRPKTPAKERVDIPVNARYVRVEVDGVIVADSPAADPVRNRPSAALLPSLLDVRLALLRPSATIS